ncbi:MAG: hypothetical protein Q8P57_04025 [Candidatus Pacearchaeota archaeon]|nr:hypothetical protein [Candidatus Pacearchaeota archaeon]
MSFVEWIALSIIGKKSINGVIYVVRKSYHYHFTGTPDYISSS